MIKEFDLDAPKHEKAERHRFGNETRCVTALFERCYKPSKVTGMPWKILVDVVSTPERERVIDLLGVLTVQVSGSVHDFLELPTPAKMETALALLMAGISRIAEKRGWDVSPFRDAEAEVRRRNFVNEWLWKAPVKNGSKSLSAQVFVQHRIDEAVISARFSDSSGHIVKLAHLVSDMPNEFVFAGYLGTFRWLDDSTVELVSWNGEKRFTAHVLPAELPARGPVPASD